MITSWLFDCELIQVKNVMCSLLREHRLILTAEREAQRCVSKIVNLNKGLMQG